MKRSTLTATASAVAIVAVTFLFAHEAKSQIRASEFSSLSQTIDGTVITIEYSRLSARGRTNLFGDVIPYGEVRTPGANWATTIETSNDITLEGLAVPAGKYSIWVLFEESEWEFALLEEDRLFHAPHPEISDDDIRFPVQPQENGVNLETLTFQFPAINSTGGTLRMQWGTTYVDMEVAVKPSQQYTVSSDAAAHYAGAYSIDIVQKPPFSMQASKVDVNLEYHNGYLLTELNIGPYSSPHELAFIPKAEQAFVPVLMMENEPAQLFEWVVYEFEVDDSGDATSFTARMASDDSVWMTGTRTR